MKPANSGMENSYKNKIQKCSLKKFINNIYSGNWKLEKLLFEKLQNNTAVDYLT